MADAPEIPKKTEDPSRLRWAFQDLDDMSKLPWNGGAIVVDAPTFERWRGAAREVTAFSLGKLVRASEERDAYKAGYELLEGSVGDALEELGGIEIYGDENPLHGAIGTLEDAQNTADNLVVEFKQ